MKRTLSLTLASLAMSILVFTAVTYTSCKKDQCKDVTCNNGGTCSDGKCTCTSEYGGPFCDTKLIIPPDSTSITFTNNVFTPISITVNGVTQSIPAGGAVTFTGPRGSVANVAASTTGRSPLGNPVGLTYIWNSLSTSFPSNSTLTIPLSVSGGFFYVKVVNKTNAKLTKCFVNYGQAAQSKDTLTIPNDSLTYGIGYYYYNPNSNVRMESFNHFWLDDTLKLTGMSNQVTTFVVK